MERVKKFAKKLLFLVLASIIAVSTMGSVNAAAETIQLGSATKTGMYIAGVSFNYKTSIDGKYYYCLDIKKGTAQNVSATLVKQNSVVDGGITYILKNGYPYKSITGDKDKDYYITQTAIWWYLDETTGSSNLGEQFKEIGSDSYGMRSLVKNLMEQGKQHRNDSTSIQTTSLEITTSDAKMKLENGSYVSKDIKASNISNMSSYTVTLTGAPSNTKIVKADGTEFDYTKAFTVNGTEAFKVKVPAGSIKDITTSITVTATGKGNTQYKAYEYKPADSSMQNIAILEKIEDTKTSKVTLDIDSTKVSVIKVDSKTNKPLAGAKLVLKDSKGNVITSWTSTINAHIIRSLPNGTYTVEETEAPEGYKLSKKVETFTISDTNKDVTVTFKNTPKDVVVTITKVDGGTNLPLAGAVLVVKDASGKEVARFTSSEESYTLTGLAYGVYTVEEESAPEGYLKSDEVIKFIIDEDHLSNQIIFENVKPVYVPDTASGTSLLMILLGIVITGTALTFVYKNGKEIEE